MLSFSERLQNGSPVNSDTTKDPAGANGSPEEQDVVGEEEILTDQLQHEKEVGDLTLGLFLLAKPLLQSFVSKHVYLCFSL